MSTTEGIDLDIPVGAPCWMDLVTNDPDSAVSFYQDVFGWKAIDAPPQFEGYRYFELDGKAVAGCMINQPEFQSPNIWSIFLRTDDARTTERLAQEHGGKVVMPTMDVYQNGSFTILQDAGGATISAWQPGTERGFGVLREDNAPVHFELHTRDYDKTVQFYRDTFGWQPRVLMDEPGFRYSTFADEENPRAGIMDASDFLPDDVPAHWSVYLGCADVDATVANIERCGGSVVMAPEDTPYGRLATVADPTGAVFKLRG